MVGTGMGFLAVAGNEFGELVRDSFGNLCSNPSKKHKRNAEKQERNAEKQGCTEGG